jgi:O-antigen/teichoic acid export membrane protein
VILARLFDRTEFGTYKQAFLIFSTMYGIAQVGMAESLFYFVPYKPHQGGRFVLNAMLVLGASGSLCVVALAFGAGRVANYMNNPGLGGYLLPVGLYLVLTLCAAVFEIVMIARKHHGRAALTYAASEGLRALFFLAPVLIFRDLHWLLYGAVAFAALRFTATVLYLRRQYGNQLMPDADLLRTQLRYALPFALAVLVEVVHTNLHQYIVSSHFDAATFAIYSVGILQIPLVDFLATPASSVMMVNMSECLRDGQTESLLEIWHDTARKLALIFFPLMSLLVISAPELITFLFTAKYAASIPIFAVWSLTVALATFQSDGVLRVFAATRWLLLLNLLRLTVVLSLVSIFLPVLHLMGAVLATVTAVLVSKTAGLLVLRKLLGTNLRRLLPWRSLGAVLGVSLFASACALLAKSGLRLPSFPTLVLTGTVFVPVYLMLLFRLRILRADERLAMTAWIKGWSPSLKTEQVETR